MFFSKPGEYKPCGMFTLKHFTLIILTNIAILVALNYTLKKDVHKIIRRCTIFVWIYEIIIIIFKINTGGIENVNNYVPLYYCSLLLYAGLLSSFCKGKLKRIGDVFLATGGIIGGSIFIIFPITSVLSYPMFHLVTFHSFIFHGIMVYLGILMNVTNYITLDWADGVYYFEFVIFFCILAYLVNLKFDSNLMFISKNFPGSFVGLIYNVMGKFFTPTMVLGQAIYPFYMVFGVRYQIEKGRAFEK